MRYIVTFSNDMNQEKASIVVTHDESYGHDIVTEASAIFRDLVGEKVIFYSIIDVEEI